jgi:hypothetical protein
MTIRRKVAIGLVTSLVLVASAALAGGSNTETAGVVRVETLSSRDWHFGCHLDACIGGPLVVPAIPVTTSGAEPSVDIVVTSTLEFQTTPGDFGVLKMRFDDGPGPAVQMSPRGWVVSSNGRFTTTTVTWVARNVPAAGATYDFELLALPRKASPDGHFHIRGRKTVVVIEMWSAG